MPHWLDLPIVEAPSAEDRTKLARYSVSTSLIEGYGGINRNTPLYQIWAHLVGQVPPINNIARVMRGEIRPSLTTLRDTVACCAGIKRPHDDEEDGKSVLIYVLNPSVTLIHYPDLVCVASVKKVPSNTVLTVQVRPQETLHSDQSQLNGVITRLEFVSSDPGNPRFPVDFETRYAQLLWRDQ